VRTLGYCFAKGAGSDVSSSRLPLFSTNESIRISPSLLWHNATNCSRAGLWDAAASFSSPGLRLIPEPRCSSSGRRRKQLNVKMEITPTVLALMRMEIKTRFKLNPQKREECPGSRWSGT
jgi:hypothetical protein